MLEDRVDLLKNELDLLKQKAPTGCNMDVVRRNVADYKLDVKELDGGLRRKTSSSYARTLRNIGQPFLTLSN